jgi:hypothetical protein
MKKHQSGFSAVEALLIVIIVGLLGLVGWHVHDSHKKTDTNSTSDNKSSKLPPEVTPQTTSKYQDDFVSMSLPVGWAAKRNDNPSLSGTKELDISGPADDELLPANADKKTFTDPYLVLKIFAPIGDVKVNAKVYGVENVTVPTLSGAKLVFSSSTGPAADASGPFEQINLATGSIDTNSTSFSQAVTINKKTLSVWATLYSNAGGQSNTEGGELNSPAKLEQSKSYQDLVKILASLQVK